MPIKVIKNLPAITKLAQENIFVMDTERAETQQIRPLQILLVNLMPTKEVTETQILRALSNSPLQVNLTFLHTASRKSKNVDEEYLDTFYRTFDEVKDKFFDGLNRNDIKKWAEKSLDFVTKDLGIERRNILHAIVHMDEKTPHLHVVAVPLVKTYNKKQNKDVWSISRRQYINGKSQLSKAQDIYNQRMNESGYELDRGEKGSSKEHTTKAQYIDKLLSENKELKRQNKELRAGVPKDNLKIWDNNNKLHNENESLKIQKEAMFEYIKEKGLGEEAQIIVNKKIRQKTNNKIKDKEWQQEL